MWCGLVTKVYQKKWRMRLRKIAINIDEISPQIWNHCTMINQTTYVYDTLLHSQNSSINDSALFSSIVPHVTLNWFIKPMTDWMNEHDVR